MSLRPLCVDLDGTLIKTDLLVEASWLMLRTKPWLIFHLLVYFFRGPLALKNFVFSNVELDLDTIPFNRELISLLRQEKARGRYLVLVTASFQTVAKDLVGWLNLFDEVYGSQSNYNLKSWNKAKFLVQLFGESGFDYVGDSKADFPVWEKANSAWIVYKSKRFLRKVEKRIPFDRQISAFQTKRSKAFLKQLRVHQWAKNLLIFLPMILSHSYDQIAVWIHSFIAFFAFSSASSSVYLLNDLLDIDADRVHPENSNRPFAAGELSLFWAAFLIPALLSFSVFLTLQLPTSFAYLLLAYMLITTLYSTVLKQIPLADIIVLALLYCWRVLAASQATGIDLSEWFLSFAIFFFLSLALVKRSSELLALKESLGEKSPRRGYKTQDFPLLVGFGVSSAYLAVLVLALYLNDPNVQAQKEFPWLLWLICPLLLYWLSRIWLKTHRGKMPSDPLVFALKDNASYGIIVVISVLWLLARGSL